MTCWSLARCPGEGSVGKKKNATLTSARACMKQHIKSLLLLLFIEENRWSFTRWFLPLSVTCVFFCTTSGSFVAKWMKRNLWICYAPLVLSLIKYSGAVAVLMLHAFNSIYSDFLNTVSAEVQFYTWYFPKIKVKHQTHLFSHSSQSAPSSVKYQNVIY